MEKPDKLVSIIIPCRNEEKYIIKCLQSIHESDYPKEFIEVLIIDGMSTDNTRILIDEYRKDKKYIKVINNIDKIVPIAMNIGIEMAKGDIIIRMDAHAQYPKEYIKKIIEWFKKADVDNIGGIIITKPGANTIIAKSIALALSLPFGVGNAIFRIGTKEPRFVETVPYGAYPKEIFEKIGLFDIELVRNQDDELNYRIIKNGGKILLDPDIYSIYYARDSLSKLWKMYFQYGYWKIKVIQKHKLPSSIRHIIPVSFIISILASSILAIFSKLGLYAFLIIIGTYLLASMIFSARISIKEGKEYLFVLPIVFATLHFSYGFGFLKGIIDFIILKNKIKNKNYNEITR